jgi:aryl-alcohol dehydrogenase-like predicted oxidoreductase
MELRPLGSTGLNASLIGLGTVKFGRNDAVKYPTDFELPDDAALARLLDVARAEGINLLDTAPAYGRAEERLGQLLQQRQDWIIVGKAGEEFEAGQSRFDFSPGAIQLSVERSLARLKTDYLDVLLLHSDGDDLAILEHSGAVECLAQLKAEGKIRAHGISSKTVAGGLRGVDLLDVVMVTLNREAQSGLAVIAAAQRQHKGVLIKKALDSGHQASELDDDGNSVASALRAIAVIRGVGSIVVGSINPQHLQQNCQAVK